MFWVHLLMSGELRNEAGAPQAEVGTCISATRCLWNILTFRERLFDIGHRDRLQIGRL